MITIILSRGPRAGERIEVDRELTLGGEGADILLDDPAASRPHVALRPGRDGLEVEDLASASGTYVGEERILSPVTVHDGATVRVGSTTFEVAVAAAVAAAGAGAQPPGAGAPFGGPGGPPGAGAPFGGPGGPPGGPPGAGGPGAPPWAMSQGVPGPRKWHTLAAVSVGMFMMMLDVTVVNVALPTIQHSLHAALSDLEWVVNGYALALAVFLLTGGRLADLYGRRLLFIIGLALFTGASLMAGLAGTNGVLITARLLQGTGAALVLPSSLGIISATFPPQERGMAIGIWSGVVGLGIAIGPLVGGLITEAISWNWIFFVNVPVGLAGLAAAWLLVDESKDPTPDQRLDAGGLILSAVCLGTLTYGLVEGNTYGFGSTRIIVMFVIAVATGAAFLILESRIDKPMLDLSLFRSRNFSGANLTTVIMGFSMLGVFFFVSLFMQNIAHFSPIGAGAAFLPMTMLMMVIPPIAGRQSDRIGARWLIVTGLVLFGLGLIAFATAGIGDGFWALLPGMLLGGAGMSLLFAPTTAVALSSVPMFKAGLASGVLNSARQAGGSLGLAVMGTVVAHDAKSGIAHGKSAASAFVTGYHAAMYIGAGVALVGAVIAGLMITNVKLPARGPGGGPPGGPPGAGPGAGGPPERAADHTADAPQPVGAGAPPAAPGPDAGSGR